MARTHTTVFALNVSDVWCGWRARVVALLDGEEAGARLSTAAICAALGDVGTPKQVKHTVMPFVAWIRRHGGSALGMSGVLQMPDVQQCLLRRAGVPDARIVVMTALDYGGEFPAGIDPFPGCPVVQAFHIMDEIPPGIGAFPGSVQAFDIMDRHRHRRPSSPPRPLMVSDSPSAPGVCPA